MNAMTEYIPAPSMTALVPRSIPEAVQLAETMARANLVPEHLRGKPGDCLLVVMQAQRWGMDAISVAQCTSVVRGKLCYEGKLVAAVLYSMGAIEGRLHYAFDGTGKQRRVTVTGRPVGSQTEESVTGSVAEWATGNDAWNRSPDDMLVYRGTRQWARRHAPDAMLGVYTPDEMETSEPQRTVTVTQEPAPPERTEYPAEDFEKNLPKWAAVIESGRKSADDIVAMVSSKYRLNDEQIAAIKACEVQDAEVAAQEGAA